MKKLSGLDCNKLLMHQEAIRNLTERLITGLSEDIQADLLALSCRSLALSKEVDSMLAKGTEGHSIMSTGL